MKKVFVYMVVFVATMALATSCKKDEKMSTEEFVRLLTSTTWRGTHQSQHNNGSWSSSSPQDVVIRFDRSNPNATSGTGLQYESSEVKSAISWKIAGEELVIEYAAGWDRSYMKFTDNECHINESSFSGIFYTGYSHRFLFNYIKDPNYDWSIFNK